MTPPLGERRYRVESVCLCRCRLCSVWITMTNSKSINVRAFNSSLKIWWHCNLCTWVFWHTFIKSQGLIWMSKVNSVSSLNLWGLHSGQYECTISVLLYMYYNMYYKTQFVMFPNNLIWRNSNFFSKNVCHHIFCVYLNSNNVCLSSQTTS